MMFLSGKHVPPVWWLGSRFMHLMGGGGWCERPLQRAPAVLKQTAHKAGKRPSLSPAPTYSLFV